MTTSFFDLLLTAIFSSGITYWVMTRKGRVSGPDTTASVEATADNEVLEKELNRARQLPGAEKLLEVLSAQARVTVQDVQKLSRQLTDLERLATVEAARRDLARQRRAPLVARYARLAMEDVMKNRKATQGAVVTE